MTAVATGKGNLKAHPRPAERRLRASSSERVRTRRNGPRSLLVLLAGIVGLVLAAALAFFILSATPVFTISSIETEPTAHLTAESIGKLAAIGEGTTLLNVDVKQVEDNIKKNPWVEEVQITREFPDRLRVIVRERTISAVVLMSSGNIAWYLGSDGRWIEPVNIDTTSNRAGSELALAKAEELGCLLIADVPSSVSPQAGYEATDESIASALLYIDGFSEEFASQVVSISAASPEAIGCTLASGVEVSLGVPSNIEAKEAVVQQILEEHAEQITYINVRVPSKPSYRKVSTDSVQAGTGTTTGGYDEMSEGRGQLDSEMSSDGDAATMSDGTGETGESYSESYDESHTGA